MRTETIALVKVEGDHFPYLTSAVRQQRSPGRNRESAIAEPLLRDFRLPLPKGIVTRSASSPAAVCPESVDSDRRTITPATAVARC